MSPLTAAPLQTPGWIILCLFSLFFFFSLTWQYTHERTPAIVARARARTHAAGGGVEKGRSGLFGSCKRVTAPGQRRRDNEQLRGRMGEEEEKRRGEGPEGPGSRPLDSLDWHFNVSSAVSQLALALGMSQGKDLHRRSRSFESFIQNLLASPGSAPLTQPLSSGSLSKAGADSRRRHGWN